MKSLGSALVPLLIGVGIVLLNVATVHSRETAANLDFRLMTYNIRSGSCLIT